MATVAYTDPGFLDDNACPDAAKLRASGDTDNTAYAAMVDDLKNVPAANAYLKQMTAQLLTPRPMIHHSSSLSSPPAPCGWGGGQCEASRAGDYMAVERFSGGIATGEDKQRYEDY